MTSKRMIVHVLMLSALSTLSAFGQSFGEGRIEVSAGYSYLNSDVSHKLERINSNGYNLAATAWLTHRVGVAADFGGLYGTAEPETPIVGQSDLHGFNSRQFNYLFGPRFRLLRPHAESRYSLTGDALFGVSRRGNISFTGRPNQIPGVCTQNCPAQSTQLVSDDTAFMYSFGTTFDVNVMKHFAIRVAQPSVVLSRFGGRNQTDFRYTAGILFRL